MAQLPINSLIVQKLQQIRSVNGSHKTMPTTSAVPANLCEIRVVKLPAYLPSIQDIIDARARAKAWNAFYSASFKEELLRYTDRIRLWAIRVNEWKLARYRFISDNGSRMGYHAASLFFSKHYEKPVKPERPQRVPRRIIRSVKFPRIMVPLPYTHKTIQTGSSWVGWVVQVRASVNYPYPPITTLSMSGPDLPTSLFFTGPFRSALTGADCVAKAKSDAITKLLIKLKDSKFNGAVAYAEAGKAYEQIAFATKKLAMALDLIRHGHLRLAGLLFGLSISRRENARFTRRLRESKPDDIEQVLSSGVLQIQYGVRPLLNDVYGAAELLAQKMSDEVIDVVKVKTDFSEVLNTTTQSSSPQSKMVCTIMQSRVVTARACVNFGRANEVAHTTAQLGITNPALIVWELLPWSFVIDWFLPVGKFIESLDATLGLVFKSGWTNYKLDTVDHYVCTRIPSNPVSYDRGRGTFHSASSVFVREVLKSFPGSQLPSFKNPASWEHALNGIALILSLRSSG